MITKTKMPFFVEILAVLSRLPALLRDFRFECFKRGYSKRLVLAPLRPGHNFLVLSLEESFLVTTRIPPEPVWNIYPIVEIKTWFLA